MFAVEKRLPCVACGEPTNFRKVVRGARGAERLVVVCHLCGERGKP